MDSKEFNQQRFILVMQHFSSGQTMQVRVPFWKQSNGCYRRKRQFQVPSIFLSSTVRQERPSRSLTLLRWKLNSEISPLKRKSGEDSRDGFFPTQLTMHWIQDSLSHTKRHIRSAKMLLSSSSQRNETSSRNLHRARQGKTWSTWECPPLRSKIFFLTSLARLGQARQHKKSLTS